MIDPVVRLGSATGKRTLPINTGLPGWQSSRRYAVACAASSTLHCRVAATTDQQNGSSRIGTDNCTDRHGDSGTDGRLHKRSGGHDWRPERLCKKEKNLYSGLPAVVRVVS